MTGRRPPFDAPQPVLRDAAVLLRPASPQDADAVRRACQDPLTQRWTTVPVPYGPEDARAYVTEQAPAAWAGQRGATWMVCAAGTDAYAGAMDLHLVDGDPGRAEVGFATAPWARRQGLCTAALRLVCAWGFGALRLARVEWRAFEGNTGSRAVAERAGFTVEGLQRARLLQRGVRRDAWVGSLLPGDPTASDPSRPTRAARPELSDPSPRPEPPD